MLVLIISPVLGYGNVDFIVNDLGDIPALEPLETLVFEEVNRVREDKGLGLLLRDTQLDDAARQHSKEMADETYVGHISPYPELEDHSLRIYNGGLTDCTVSENIYWTTEVAPDRILNGNIVQGWLDSEPHRKAMLTRDFNYSGMGIYRADDGGLYCTQLFSDRTVIFDEIELSDDVEYVRRVTATFAGDEDIIYLLDGDYRARFTANDGAVLVDFFLIYEDQPVVIMLGREVRKNEIDIFYENEVIPSAGFFLSYEVMDDSLIREDVNVEKIGKYTLRVTGQIINPDGDLFIVDGDVFSPVEYEEDGTFFVDYSIYDNTGVHSIYFTIDNSANHKLIVNSEKPLDEAFMKMQVLPDR
ncbi:MAG: CAP domain-containing protein [bacterium]|nr:CAP domain-containing protein [bacterium]